MFFFRFCYFDSILKKTFSLNCNGITFPQEKKKSLLLQCRLSASWKYFKFSPLGKSATTQLQIATTLTKRLFSLCHKFQKASCYKPDQILATTLTKVIFSVVTNIKTTCLNFDQTLLVLTQVSNHLPQVWSNFFSVATTIKPLATTLIKPFFCYHKYQTTCLKSGQIRFPFATSVKPLATSLIEYFFHFVNFCQT